MSFLKYFLNTVFNWEIWAPVPLIVVRIIFQDHPGEGDVMWIFFHSQETWELSAMTGKWKDFFKE